MNLTPIEKYKVNGYEVLVKREDLSYPPPAPPFAKTRGIEIVLKNYRDHDVDTVGYVDTAISMGGWGVAYFAKKLAMKAIIFRPKYKDGLRYNQAFQEKKWLECGATIIDIEKPNHQQINYHRAKKILSYEYPDGFMLPLGLPFKETVNEVAKQVTNADWYSVFYGTIVACVGSGTMMAGIIKGLSELGIKTHCVGIQVAPKSDEGMRKRIIQKSGYFENVMWFNKMTPTLEIIDLGYEYTEAETCACPFPCNPWYDRKAWKFVVDNIETLKHPVLFWNIGS